MNDSTVAKRPAVPRRKSVVEQVVSDVKTGFPELQRQMGTAVEAVKSGARRVKRFLNK